MNVKMNQANRWLINEIMTELQEKFLASKSKLEKAIKESNFFSLLVERPAYVHHESPEHWANTIARQNNLVRKQ